MRLAVITPRIHIKNNGLAADANDATRVRAGELGHGRSLPDLVGFHELDGSISVLV